MTCYNYQCVIIVIGDSLVANAMFVQIKDTKPPLVYTVYIVEYTMGHGVVCPAVIQLESTTGGQLFHGL